MNWQFGVTLGHIHVRQSPDNRLQLWAVTDAIPLSPMTSALGNSLQASVNIGLVRGVDH